MATPRGPPQQRGGGGGGGGGSGRPSPAPSPAPPQRRSSFTPGSRGPQRAGGGRSPANGSATPPVNEQYKIAISKRIDDFRASDDDQLIFPAMLTNLERKYVHEICGKLGLKSKSQGKNEHRFLTVCKPNLVELQGGSSLLKISPAALRFLDSIFAEQPIQPWELDLVRRIKPEGSSSKITPAPQRSKSSSLPVRPPPAPRRVPEISAARKKLPIFKHREDILEEIASHQVTIISGETGSGKSTQVVQFLMDCNPGHNIVCTQPRRLSAIALAERVAEERSENGSVGYAVRLESSPGDRLMFCTTGVLLSSMRDGLSRCKFLAGVTHLIIDEIHERDRNADFLLAICREILTGSTPFRLILMSATLTVETFARYFAQVGIDCGLAKVSGSQFPVRQLFLEDVLFETKYCDKLQREQSEIVAAANGLGPVKLLTCPMCGSSNFANAAAFGVHAAECTGVLGVSTKASSSNPSREGEDSAMRADASEENQSAVDALGSKEGEDDEVDVWGSSASKINNSTRATPTTGATIASGAEVDATAVSLQALNVDMRPEDASNLSRYLASRPAEDDNEADLMLILALLERIESVGDASFFTHAAPAAMALRSDAVLVFLPGWAEISRLVDLMQAHLIFGDASKYLVLPLHSGVPTKDQKRVFARPPPNVRKVVVATNIAETSITIDDVVYVIDSGLMKEKSYDPISKINSLLPMYISRANAVQRKGRAGRCRYGVCFHLMSRARYAAIPAEQVPEICRTPLEELCLQVRALLDSADVDAIFDPDTTVAEFFAKCPTPPSPNSILNAMDLLRRMGAVDADEGITRLGRVLAGLPVEVRAGKMLLLGAFLKSSSVALTLACSSGFRDVFVTPLSQGDRVKARAARVRFANSSIPGMTDSDHAALLGAYALYSTTKRRGGVGAARAVCSGSFLQPNVLETLDQMRGQVQRQLGSVSPLLQQGKGEGLSNAAVVMALVCAATQPNLALLRDGASKLAAGAENKISPHSVSVVDARKDSGEKFFVFEELVRGPRQCLMRNATSVPPLCVALFSGFLALDADGIDGLEGQADNDDEGFRLVSLGTSASTSEIRLKAWVRLTAPTPVAEKVAVLRLRFESAFRRVAERGRVDISEQKLAEAVVNVLTLDLMGGKGQQQQQQQ